jgi:ubiquitin C-terminal hydrolase
MIPLNYIFLPKPNGLYNTGSICYFNSLLQVLLGCTSLYSWIPDKKSQLAIVFKDILQNSSNLDPMSSTKLLLYLKNELKKNISFGNGQESVSELLMLLLNNINDINLTNLFTYRFRYNIICLNCSYKSEQIKDESILFEMFHINNLTENNMMNYNINLPEYKCEKCNNIGAIKKSKLTMLSEIIVCLFNVYYDKKIHTFPTYLEFPGNNNTTLKYTIVGQIEHFGSLNGGHYYARALRNNGIYLFNDNSFNISEFLPTPNTYIIVYHLIKNT